MRSLPERDRPVAVRLATWNINGLNARLEYLLLWLREVQPDIVALQELKMTEAQFPEERFRELGYDAAVLGQKSWNGVAVLSRRPMTVTQAGLPGQEAMGSRLLTVEVDGLSLTSLYAPNGKSIAHEDFERKLQWFDALASYVVATFDADAPCVLTGDFNIVPAPLDSWNEEGLSGQLFHTRDERARLDRLASWGLVDVFRRLHREAPGFSWWDYRAGAFHKGMGLRIDLVLMTATLAERATDAVIERQWRKKVDGRIPSDHAPVWVDFDGGIKNDAGRP